MPNINAFRPVVQEKTFFKDLSAFFLILLLIGPKNGPTPLFEPIRIPIPQACFPPSLVEICQAVLEKKSFKGKS